MKSIRCPECDLMGWLEAQVCKRCGHVFKEFAEKANEQQEFEENSILKEEYKEDHYESDEDSYHDEYEKYDEGQEESYHDEYEEYDGQEESHHEEEEYIGNEELHYDEFAEYEDKLYEPVSTKQPKLNKKNSKNYEVIKPSRKMALVSMVLGIIGLPFLLFWGAFLADMLAEMLDAKGAIIAGGTAVLVLFIGLILGISAFMKINRRPKEYDGKPFAVTGIVCSSIGILIVPVMLLFLIPNLLSGQIAASEDGIVSSIEKLARAETNFRVANNGRCGTLEELAQRDSIDADLAKGNKDGYRFIIVALPNLEGGCEIMAVPDSESAGLKSFYYSTEDKVFRAAVKNGELANKNDSPIRNFKDNHKDQISLKK